MNIFKDEYLKYPQFDIEQDKELTNDQITKAFSQHLEFKKKFKENEAYFRGRNQAIMNKKNHEDNKEAPNNKIPVPYSRTMTLIVKGYAFKPGLITYTTTDKDYQENLNYIFKENQESITTAEIGEDISKYGISFELLYIDETDEGETIPYFTRVPPDQIIPIYNYSIKKELVAALYYYEVEDKERLEIYYPSVVVIYDKVGISITERSRKDHFLGQVPVIIYINNDEFLADYEPVKPLIDVYDLLISESLNELQRFAAAYLLLVNFIFAENEDEKKRKLKRMKELKLFEVPKGGDVRFLEKSIPDNFFNSLKDALREDIEYHSHIPDFRGKNFQAKSGEAQKWALFDFENLCADKETNIKKGLMKRLKLITNYFKFKKNNSYNWRDVEIKFTRNIPQNLLAEAELAQKLKGIVPDREIYSLLSFLEDVEKTLEEMKTQKEDNFNAFSHEELKNIDEEEEKEGENVT